MIMKWSDDKTILDIHSMNYRRDRTVFFLFTLVALVLFSLYFRNLELMSMKRFGILHVEAGSSTLYLSDCDVLIHGWDNDGITYFFIPSNENITSIYQDVEGSSGVIYSDDRSLLSDPRYGVIQDVKVDFGEESATSWKIEFLHSSNIHTMFIDLNNENLDDIDHDIYIPAEMRLYTSDGKLEYSEKQLLIKGRGNSTWHTEKQPYEIKLTENYPLCGLNSSSKWALLANFYDDTKILNKMMMDLSDEIGMPYAIDSDWVDLYVNGEYRGNYLLTKDPGIGKGRLELTEGNFFEKTTQIDAHDNDQFFIINNDYFRIKDPNPVSNEDYLFCYNLVSDIDRSLQDNSWSMQSEFIDVSSFARRFLIDEFSFRSASMQRNCYFYNVGDTLYAGPCWDYDLSCGESLADPYYMNYNESLLNNVPVDALQWDRLLFDNNDYKEYYDRLFYTVEPLLADLICNRIDCYAEKIEDSLAMDRVRWDGEEAPVRFYNETDNKYRYLKFFLYQRLKLLGRECMFSGSLPEIAITNGEKHIVVFDKGDGSPVSKIYKDGDVISPTDLPQYDDSQCRWIFEREQQDYSPYIPVFEDMVLVLTEE